jgi:hypothetical protein
VSEEMRCPVCGLGTFRDIAYDEAPVGNAEPPAQDADSHQVVTYTCGHQVVGPRLSVADAEVLDVERRTTDETVEPVTTGDDGPAATNDVSGTGPESTSSPGATTDGRDIEKEATT